MAHSNTTDLYTIVSQMDTVWSGFRCSEAQPLNNQFHYGYPQEVDNIHDKNMPLMVCNMPTSTSTLSEYEKNIVDNTTNFKIQIYQYRPSDVPAITAGDALLMDGMENCFYLFLQTVLNNLGSRVVLGGGSLNISRRDQSSNDQLLQLDITFTLNYYRYCLALTQ